MLENIRRGFAAHGTTMLGVRGLRTLSLIGFGSLLCHSASAQSALVAASQSPAVMANLPLSVSLTTHATVPSGQTASIYSLTTSGTHGSVGKSSATTVTYTPGSYYATLLKGASATDKFNYCLTDAAKTVSCNTVSVTIFGAATATVTPPPPATPATSASYSCVRNWYISPTGNDSASGISTSAPWKTLAHADASGLLMAGDCVNLASGTYGVNSTVYFEHGGNANSATGYVVYRSSTPHGAVIQAVGDNMYDLLNAQANYMIFDGLEINGGNAGRTSSPITSGHCLEADGHHFQALNNVIHDCGGAAISAVYKDWYWIEGNTVYNNAFFNTYQASGISIYEPRAVSFTATPADTSATYHITIANNTAYSNGEWYVSGAHSDGNGIILDDFQNTQSGDAAYPYQSLVQGNTAYSNGARGIHLFYSDHVTVTGNIAYNNNSDTAIDAAWRGELSNACGNNNTWSNNQASATSVTTDIRKYNTAVLDGHVNTATVGVTWSGNANLDTRTGGKSYQIDNTARDSAFPAANPLGKAL
jgi:parallel beta-helix repeat protein